ncbi:MAG: hypothetical protein ACRBFS_09075 [Aureispira sp.]
MRWINKKRPPKELQEFKAKLDKQKKEDGVPHEKPFGLLKSDPIANPAVQIALAKEQGYICCYCMAAIPIKEGEEERPVARIEHFKPRSVYDGMNKQPDLRIDYSNFLLACENKHSHCDIKKKDKELCEVFSLTGKRKRVREKLRIGYTKTCVIYSQQASIHEDIGGDLKADKSGDYQEGILNLNCKSLRDQRKGAWKGVSKYITRQIDTPKWEDKKAKALQVAQDLHEKYSNRNKNQKFYPFCEVILYQLEKRFKELRSI